MKKMFNSKLAILMLSTLGYSSYASAQININPKSGDISLKSGTSAIDERDTIVYQVQNLSSNNVIIPSGSLEAIITLSQQQTYTIDNNNSLSIPNWNIVDIDQNSNQLKVRNSAPIDWFTSLNIEVPVVGKIISGANPTNISLNVIASEYTDVNLDDNVSQIGLPVIAIPTPLPIRLVTFGATMIACNDVNVAWETSSESNVSHYEVEYSITGGSFVTVAEVPAKNQAATYEIVVNQEDKLGFYRLKSVDFDGTFAYSKIAQVQSFDCNTAVYQALPNPSNGVYTIKGENTSGLVQVMDITGKVIYSMNYDNLNQAKVDITTYPAGTYQMRVITQNGKVSVFKMIKL